MRFSKTEMRTHWNVLGAGCMNTLVGRDLSKNNDCWEKINHRHVATPFGVKKAGGRWRKVVEKCKDVLETDACECQGRLPLFLCTGNRRRNGAKGNVLQKGHGALQQHSTRSESPVPEIFIPFYPEVMGDTGVVQYRLSNLCFLCLALLLSSTLTQGENFCPDTLAKETCSCLSYLDGAVIRCKGPDAPYEVERLKTQQLVIRELAIEEADIVEVGPRAFRNLKIRNLIMDKNRIHAIHKDAFAGLERTLVSLSIAHNKLTEIPTDALIGMESLLVLNLKCNNIGNIYTPALHNVSRLIELNLACNQICKISGSAFEPIKGTLQSLILDHNCLREVPAEALRNFKSLLALHLQHNNIETIEKLQLMNMVSLLMVRLSHNRIKSIDRYGFNNIPNMRYLFLDHNQLNVIEPNVLQQFQFLEIADLSYNNIAEITAGVFQGLERLLQLNLEGNVIQDIAPNAFAQTPLLLLLLGQNCLTGISQSVFQGIPFLRQLSMANNNIKNIQPFAFTSLANLQLLDLSGNKLDSVFPATLAPNFGSTIILSENPLVCGPAGYHVVQGGKPIMLLNEQNLICSALNRSRPDNCPNRKPEAQTTTCCSTDDDADTVDVSNIRPGLTGKKTQLEYPAMLEVPSATSVQPVERQYHSTSAWVHTTAAMLKDTTAMPFTTAAPVEMATRKPGKGGTPNMQRFWRLTKPPAKEHQILLTTTSPEAASGNLQAKAKTPEELSKQRVLQASRGTLQAVQRNKGYEKENWSPSELAKPIAPGTVTSGTILMLNKENATAYSSQKQPHIAKAVETEANTMSPAQAGKQSRPTQIATRLIKPAVTRPKPRVLSSETRQLKYHSVPAETQLNDRIQPITTIHGQRRMGEQQSVKLQHPLRQTNWPVDANFGTHSTERNAAQQSGQASVEDPAQLRKAEIPKQRSHVEEDVQSSFYRYAATMQPNLHEHPTTGDRLLSATNAGAIRNVNQPSHIQRQFQSEQLGHSAPQYRLSAGNMPLHNAAQVQAGSAQQGNLDLVEQALFMQQPQAQWQVPVSAPMIQIANEPQTFGPTKVRGIEGIPFNTEPFVGLHFNPPKNEEQRPSSRQPDAQPPLPNPFVQQRQ
uniref:LRRCT domain-containing protein n=1 Tax=Trichuris muris TaxID=70415 RepID=A0A5S6QHL5_TRIMR